MTHPNRKRASGRPLVVSIGLALGVKAIALAILYFAFFVPPAAMAPLPDAVFGSSSTPSHNG